jgi:hypothetical protein
LSDRQKEKEVRKWLAHIKGYLNGYLEKQAAKMWSFWVSCLNMSGSLEENGWGRALEI